MRRIADANQVEALIEQLAAAIARDHNGGGPWALIGVRQRGDVLASRLAQKLRPDHVGALDITLYRDDLLGTSAHPMIRGTEIPFAVDGLDIVLVDDVLMTGRSVRAALQVVIDLGRPRRIRLAVLVDRGGRELPIAPDYVGLDLSAEPAGTIEPGQRVRVQIVPVDPQDAIVVDDAPPSPRE